ncbi:MAG: hypothetical protein AB8E15_13495 [Bdellovibrionales bacterium]
MRFLIVSFLFVLIGMPGLSSDKNLINRTLAKINGELVSTRDLEAYKILESILKSDSKILVLSQKDLLENLALNKIVYAEAEQFNLGPASSREINNLKSQFFKGLKASKLETRWNQLAITRRELSDLVAQSARTTNFIKMKKQSSQVLVSENQIRSYFEKNRKIYPGELNEYRLSIRSVIGREQGEARLAEWYQILRQKYKVVLY